MPVPPWLRARYSQAEVQRSRCLAQCHGERLLCCLMWQEWSPPVLSKLLPVASGYLVHTVPAPSLGVWELPPSATCQPDPSIVFTRLPGTTITAHLGWADCQVGIQVQHPAGQGPQYTACLAEKRMGGSFALQPEVR